VRPCPVCEAPVSGWLCEVCGKQVGPSPAAAGLTVPLEGLESTQLPPDGLGLAIEPAPGLEPTAVSAVPEVPGEPLLGWEATQALQAPEVSAGGLVDLDPGRAAPEGAPAVAPSVATCRYCRNVQASGLFCDRCGMRLPWAVPAAAATAEAGEPRVCRRCGERSPPSMERCGACGALLTST
jgi:ribosomal protein L40E